MLPSTHGLPLTRVDSVHLPAMGVTNSSVGTVRVIHHLHGSCEHSGPPASAGRAVAVQSQVSVLIRGFQRETTCPGR